MSAPLAFLLGPIGRYLLIGVAVLAWTVYQRDQAATKATAQCRAEQAEAVVAEVQRQRLADERINQDAEKQEAVAAQELAALEKSHAETIRDLREDALLSCRVPKRAIQRLQHIR